MDSSVRKISPSQLLVLQGIRALEPEATGYAIAKRMRLRPQQVYPVLAQLRNVHPGLILVEEEPVGKQRKFYKLTGEGRELAKQPIKPSARRMTWQWSRKKCVVINLDYAILWELDKAEASEPRLAEELAVSLPVLQEQLVRLCQMRFIILPAEGGKYFITDKGHDALWYIKVMAEGVEDV
jgi:predicted transcriptional regulator